MVFVSHNIGNWDGMYALLKYDAAGETKQFTKLHSPYDFPGTFHTSVSETIMDMRGFEYSRKDGIFTVKLDGMIVMQGSDTTSTPKYEAGWVAVGGGSRCGIALDEISLSPTVPDAPSWAGPLSNGDWTFLLTEGEGHKVTSEEGKIAFAELGWPPGELGVWVNQGVQAGNKSWASKTGFLKVTRATLGPQSTLEAWVNIPADFPDEADPNVNIAFVSGDVSRYDPEEERIRTPLLLAVVDKPSGTATLRGATWWFSDLTSPVPMTLGEWHHVALAMDINGLDVTLYQDGRYVGSVQDDSEGSLALELMVFTFGQHADHDQQTAVLDRPYLLIDQLRMSSRILQPEEFLPGEESFFATMSGKVTYWGSDVPISSVQITVRTDSASYFVRTTTDEQGLWDIPEMTVYTGDTYRITPVKYGDVPDCITSLDAASVLVYLADTAFFVDPFQKKPADASGDGDIEINDVIAILRYSVGLPVQSVAGQWRFDPDSIAEGGYVPGEHIIDKNFDAYLVGDVTGNYGGQVPVIGGASLASAQDWDDSPLTTSTRIIGDTLEMSICLNDNVGRVLSMDLEMVLYDELAELIGIVSDKEDRDAMALSSLVNSELKVAAITGGGFQSSDPIVRLRFLARKEINSLSQFLELRSCRLNDVELTGEALMGLISSLEKALLPKTYSLSQNYPNPFNPSTTIKFDIPSGVEKVWVELSVYNIRGQLVRRLVNEEKKPGKYSLEWDGRYTNGRPASSGVYFYRIKAGEFKVIRKMVLLK